MWHYAKSSSVAFCTSMGSVTHLPWKVNKSECDMCEVLQLVVTEDPWMLAWNLAIKIPILKAQSGWNNSNNSSPVGVKIARFQHLLGSMPKNGAKLGWVVTRLQKRKIWIEKHKVPYCQEVKQDPQILPVIPNILMPCPTAFFSLTTSQ